MNSRALTVGVLLLLAGCATATGRGENALHAGRYDEAVVRFQEALAEKPDNVTARVGLGIAQYRLGALDDAGRTLNEALRQEFRLPVAHLYVGLIGLLRGQDAVAGESLRRYAAAAGPRVTTGVERALRALASGPVSEDMRRYVASSLEDQSAWAGELVATQQALANAELRRITDDRTLLLLPRACQCR